MNQRACLVGLILSTVSMGTLAGAPIGSDNFDDNSRSPVNWAEEFTTNLGRLQEAGQRLQYTTAGNPGESSPLDFAAWVWGRNDPRPAQEWTFQLDVSLPDLKLTASQSVFFGLEAADQRNPQAVFSLGYNSRAGGTPHTFTAVTPKGTVTRECTVLTPCGSYTSISDLTAIRFRFDGATSTLFTDFDPNASDGYSWTNLSTTPDFIPDTIYVFGQSSNRAVTAADNVYGDNVMTTAVLVPEPSTYAIFMLGIALLGWVTRASRSRILS